MKKVLLVVAILIFVAVGVFLYLARPVKAPSEDAPGVEVNDSRLAHFRIVSERSQAEFRIDEVLRGEPFTAVGTTGAVSGDIVLDMENPSSSPLGTLRVNARTFMTDSRGRDTAIARFILKSEEDANEFITFTPTSLQGISGSMVVGEPFSFEVTGDMTIAGVTREVMFDVTAELVSDTELSGRVEGTVRRSDFGLTIPEVSFVARVHDEVQLSVEFVALKVLQ